jgi:Tfp pilus assembly protein PilF
MTREGRHGNSPYPGWLSFSRPVTPWGVPFSKLSRTTEAAVGYFELGMIEAALQELDQLSPGDQREPEVLELRSVIHQHTGQWSEAARAFQALCARRDADVEHFIGWGCCLYELGAYEEARQALLSAPEAMHRNGLWNFHLACYEALAGHGEAARKRVELAIRLDPCLRHMAQQNSNLAPLLKPVS